MKVGTRAVSSPTTYNRELIERCIEDLAYQEQEWDQWFADHGVRPFKLAYEDLAADRAGTIQAIVALLGAEGDQRKAIEIPAFERQSDGTNAEWIARFEAESKGENELPPAKPTIANEQASVSADAGI